LDENLNSDKLGNKSAEKWLKHKRKVKTLLAAQPDILRFSCWIVKVIFS
jgi:hypothetical protein